LETYLILDLPGERGKRGMRGMRIPLSLKSVLLIWLKCGCAVVVALVGALVAGALLNYAVDQHRITGLIAGALVFLAACAFPFGLSYLVPRASASRAAELAAHLGVSEEVLADLTTPNEERLKNLEAYLKAHPDALDRPRPYDGDEEDKGPPERSIRRGRDD
jgi:hypothetical protein